MWPFTKTLRAEDPDRLRRFLEHLENIDWRNSSSTALASTYGALNDLIYHEVLFYYRARKKQRLFSIATRGTAVMLGTLGVMAPLLASSNAVVFGFLAPYGYPLLVGAASVLVINKMFGATGGHIRYVTAQLELERIITKFRLAWLEFQSAAASTAKDSPGSNHAFKLMNAFVDEAYRVIQEETSVWGRSVSEALQEYEKRLLTKAPGAEIPPPSGP